MSEFHDGLRLIGDVHGHFPAYKAIVATAKFSLQIGDMAFNYAPLDGISSTKHTFFGGNHDNYDALQDESICPPHYLKDGFGDYIVPGAPPLFYVRGGFSIDHKERVPGLTWWPDEELRQDELDEAVAYWLDSATSILVSHECPLELVKHFTTGDVARLYGYDSVVKTRTNTALQKMVDNYPPSLSVFGHYHLTKVYETGPTTYICLGELSYLDLLPDNRARLYKRNFPDDVHKGGMPTYTVEDIQY